MNTEKTLTGYPSIDRPWMKFYTKEAINTKMPECSMYQFAFNNNKQDLNSCCFEYYGTKITYSMFFDKAIAFVTLSNHENVQDKVLKIKNALEKELPEHMQPQSVVVLKGIPLTTSGKVDYRALEKLAQNERKHYYESRK